MKFNIKKFKNNILFFIVSIALIIVLLLVSVLFGKKGVSIEGERELLPYRLYLALKKVKNSWYWFY